jgi:hypothetical protein
MSPRGKEDQEDRFQGNPQGRIEKAKALISLYDTLIKRKGWLEEYLAEMQFMQQSVKMSWRQRIDQMIDMLDDSNISFEAVECLVSYDLRYLQCIECGKWYTPEEILGIKNIDVARINGDSVFGNQLYCCGEDDEDDEDSL